MPKKIICPYCDKEAIFTNSSTIYNGKDYGMIYLCINCGAYVGVHRGTDIPLGRLANKELREWKMKAHDSFDVLWKGDKKKMSRRNAYKWLSNKMNIDEEKCHIGLFDVEQCQRVIKIMMERGKDEK